MKTINICYIINQKYLPLTLTSMGYVRNFFKGSNEYRLRFIIFGLDDLGSRTSPYRTAKKAGDVEFIESPFGDMPLCHQRAKIFDILDVDRFIFLDSDTVTTTCISRLWEVNLKNNILGAVEHYYFPTFKEMGELYDIDCFSSLGENKFFNCGVMLMDGARWRGEGITEKYFKAIRGYSDTIHKRKDEPAMNAVLHDRWLVLNKKWNYLPRGGFRKSYITHYYGDYLGQKPRHEMF